MISCLGSGPLSFLAPSFSRPPVSESSFYRENHCQQIFVFLLPGSWSPPNMIVGLALFLYRLKGALR